MIPTKNCITCAAKVSTFALNPLCQTCIKINCSLSHTKDSIGRHKCNNLKDMVQRDDKTMCIGHYKKLQNHCRCCGNPRKSDETLAYDNWYYCGDDTPDINTRNILINKYLGNVLCNDVICKIIQAT